MALETQHLKDSRSNSDDNILPKGAILQNRYEVIKVLGVGGMGAVYLTQDLRFTGVKRFCALKEMISSTPDPHVRRLAVESFKREANLLAQLRHPGIPHIIDFFTDNIRSYLAMEYVEGEDLENVLDSTEGMLKEDIVLDWAIQVCDVLIYLHNQTPPIIFRDLKPSNVMLREDNKIALIDFGIAKAFESGQKGTMIGTEGYSPPEQYKGIAEPAGDIYALGATLHHLLTKRDPRLEPPFTFHEEPVKLLNPAISDQTSAVIMQALEYDITKRFSTARSFKDALEAALKGEGDSPAQAAGTQMLSKTPGTTLLPDQPSVPQQQQPPAPQYPSQPYPPQYPPQPYPGQYPPPYPPQPYPGQYPPQGYPYPPAGPGGFAPESEEDIGDSIMQIWKFKCEDEVRASPSSDGKYLYIGSYDNNVYALDLISGEFQWKYATDDGIATKPFVYKNNLIFGSQDRVAYAVTTLGRLVWTCPTEDRIRSSAVVEFDHAFFGSDDHRLYAVNAQTGRIIWRFASEGPIRSSPILGEELVYAGSEDGHLYAVDLSTGANRWKFRANRGITSSPIVFEDLVIVGCSDWNVYGVDAKSGYSIWRTRTKNLVISSPVLVDGSIYIGSADNNLYVLDASNGRVQWKYNAESQIISTPAVTDEAVYFGTSAGEVISIGRKDRKLRWKFKTGGPVTSSPLVVNDRVYIGSTDKYVYALPA